MLSTDESEHLANRYEVQRQESIPGSLSHDLYGRNITTRTEIEIDLINSNLFAAEAGRELKTSPLPSVLISIVMDYVVIIQTITDVDRCVSELCENRDFVGEFDLVRAGLAKSFYDETVPKPVAKPIEMVFRPADTYAGTDAEWGIMWRMGAWDDFTEQGQRPALARDYWAALLLNDVEPLMQSLEGAVMATMGAEPLPTTGGTAPPATWWEVYEPLAISGLKEIRRRMVGWGNPRIADDDLWNIP